MASVLVVTRDPALRDELTRLAAAAGVEVCSAGDAASALRRWSVAELVVVGADLADPFAELDPPRRSQVVVVASGPAADPAFRAALALGAEQVVSLPDSGPWLTARMADLGDERARPGRVVGVVGGSGGAGATTFACALGQVGARTGPVLVVDLDPLGPGLDRVLGLDERTGARWDDLDRTAGRLGARALRDAVPGRDGLGVLTWSAGSASGPAPATVRECVSAARRGHDLVVVDLPRSLDPRVDEVLVRCDVVLVLVRPTLASTAAAVRLVGRLPDLGTVGLVARGSGVDPGDVSAVTGVPVLAEMADQRRLAEWVDLGLGPAPGRRGPLARAAAHVLAQVAA